MGSSFSCCFNKSELFDCVRVIHVNGYVQDFSCPVTAAQITGKPPKHVLCTSAHLLSTGAQPIRPEDPLESGRVYFLLPRSVFMSDSSAIDLASLVTRLTAAANRAGPADPMKARSLSDPGAGLEERKSGWGLERLRTWKPALETIREVSFRRRESMASFGSMSIGSMSERGGSVNWHTCGVNLEKAPP